jgi:hypothetical protein
MDIDPRVWTLILLYIVWAIVVGLGETGIRLSNRLTDHREGRGAGCLWVVLAVPVSVLLGAFFDWTLWNMVAPDLGLPQIDLLTALALSWLTLSLFRGMSTPRMRLVEPKLKARRDA